MQDFLRMPFMKFRKNSFNEDEKKRKEKDLENMKQFITKRKPHVIVIGAEDRSVGFYGTVEYSVRLRSIWYRSGLGDAPPIAVE